MTIGYVISGPAMAEVDDVWLHIAQDSPQAADRQIEAFYARFGMIARHPRAGRVRDDIEPGVRVAIEGNYVVIYRIVAAGVEILHVVHGSRDIHALL